MPLFSPPRPGLPGGRGRTRLYLESLDERDHPSSLLASDDVFEPSSWVGSQQQTAIAVGEENAPPEIVDFTAEESGNGQFVISGRVIDENSEGLIVTFESGLEQVNGQTAEVAADGTFYIVVQLPADGSVGGTVVATTVDEHEAVSNRATTHVDPTISGGGGFNGSGGGN